MIGALKMAEGNVSSNAFDDPSMMLRVHSTALLIVWACYSGVLAVTLILFMRREHIQPIKSRSPRLVAVSCLGGWLVMTNNAFANYVTGLAEWPCPFSLWVIWFAYPCLFVPVPFRSLLRLYQIHVVSRKHRESQETRERPGLQGRGPVSCLRVHDRPHQPEAHVAHSKGLGPLFQQRTELEPLCVLLRFVGHWVPEGGSRLGAHRAHCASANAPNASGASKPLARARSPGKDRAAAVLLRQATGTQPGRH